MEDGEQDFLDQMAIFPLDQLASPQWLLHHGAVVQLSLRALWQTAQLREETVHHKLTSQKKLAMLVHDAILIEMWRDEIETELVSKTASVSPLLFYSILYHEGSAVTLLELSLYHASGCQALGDAVIDLIDYCHRTLTRSAAARSSHDAAGAHAHLRHLDVIQLENSLILRCIAILRYVAGHSDVLSETVTSRMLTTTDVPTLVVRLMEQRPWMRPLGDGRFQIYDNGQWVTSQHPGALEASGRMHPAAAHLWLLFLSLLMSPVAPMKYQLDHHRCRQLLKMRGHLNERALEEIPALRQLERWLTELSIGGSHLAWGQKTGRRPLILEVVAELRHRLLLQVRSPGQVIDRQRHRLSPDSETPDILQKLAVIYDAENMEKTMDACKTPSAGAAQATGAMAGVGRSDAASTGASAGTCSSCRNGATQRCSRCRQRHYCSKQCQVKDWPQHKTRCRPAIRRSPASANFSRAPLDSDDDSGDGDDTGPPESGIGARGNGRTAGSGGGGGRVTRL